MMSTDFDSESIWELAEERFFERTGREPSKEEHQKEFEDIYSSMIDAGDFYREMRGENE